MDKASVTVIGAGVVGLSVAAHVAMKGRDVLVVERHEGFGRETSSRNSGTIHSGIYYSAGSLKAKLCVEGNALLYHLCSEKGIPYKPLGKLIVAVNEQEEKGLQDLMERGKKNGVRDLRILSANEALSLEPSIWCRAALLVPSSGIVDGYRLMEYYEATARNHNARMAYGCEVRTIERCADGYRMGVKDADGAAFVFDTRVLINSAGLESDKVAALAGVDIDQAGYRLHYLKGSFFRIPPAKQRLTQRLIYPFPMPSGSLGAHTVPETDGTTRIGPYDSWVESLDYAVDAAQKRLCYDSVKPFLPYLELDDMEPDTSGIRPRLQVPGGPTKDFMIAHEEKRGLPGLIDLVGMESPGLTSSAAIGKLVAGMVEDIL